VVATIEPSMTIYAFVAMTMIAQAMAVTLTTVTATMTMAMTALICGRPPAHVPRQRLTCNARVLAVGSRQ